ncbi:unnamed protein product, partial [Brassica oleracea var. botrytis]
VAVFLLDVKTTSHRRQGRTLRPNPFLRSGRCRSRRSTVTPSRRWRVDRDSPQRLTLLESIVRGVSFAGGHGEAQHPSTGDNSISVRSKWVLRGICGYMVCTFCIRIA